MLWGDGNVSVPLSCILDLVKQGADKGPLCREEDEKEGRVRRGGRNEEQEGKERREEEKRKERIMRGGKGRGVHEELWEPVGLPGEAPTVWTQGLRGGIEASRSVGMAIELRRAGQELLSLGTGQVPRAKLKEEQNRNTERK